MTPHTRVVSTRATALPPEQSAKKGTSSVSVAITLSVVLVTIISLWVLRRAFYRCIFGETRSPPPARASYLSRDMLDSIPIYKFTSAHLMKSAALSPDDISTTPRDERQPCSICTESFKVGSKLRALPCGHVFHRRCIDPWLLRHSVQCPLWCV